MVIHPPKNHSLGGLYATDCGRSGFIFYYTASHSGRELLGAVNNEIYAPDYIDFWAGDVYVVGYGRAMGFSGEINIGRIWL